jgi:ubiquinone/menaquinone biosynthesis C-methylase UbiE
MKKISAARVRADFNHLTAVMHYTRAAHRLGLWNSERILIEHFFPDPGAALIEAGCGAGRATLGLWEIGFRHVTGFDFAAELVDQARSLAIERKADTLRFLHADATALDQCHELRGAVFQGALFLFNGLMQIPGRQNRRAALAHLHRVCAPGSPLLFTTHDRDSSPAEKTLWRLEAARWQRGKQDPRLVEFGDRYFSDEAGRTFMHLPDRAEILEDLEATGWAHAHDAMRREIAAESRAVRDFSDDCRFWAAHRRPATVPEA